MKITLSICLLVATSFGVFLFAGPANTSSSEPLRLRNLESYVKITEQPFEMHDLTVAFCKAPPEPDAIPTNPHDPSYPKTAFCNVYVNAIAKDAMLSGR